MNTVLLVENDPHQQALYVEELHDEGFRVVCAATGAEAMRVAQRVPIDCVVLDVQLSMMDGIQSDGESGNGVEVLAHMKQRWPQLPVIVYTAQSFDPEGAEQHTWEKQGASRYLLKQSDTSKLVSAVHQVLEHPPATLPIPDPITSPAPGSGAVPLPAATNQPPPSSASLNEPYTATGTPDTRVDPYQNPTHNLPDHAAK